MFVVAGARHPLARRRKLAFAEIVNEPWILPPPDTAVGGYIAELFRAGGLDAPPLGVVCSSIKMQYDMVADGRFLGLFPRSLLHFDAKPSPIRVLPVELPKGHATGLEPVGIVTLKNRTISPVAQLFIARAREIAKPLAKMK
jgi:DNA-binding transcriptional LysR family regulator